MRRFAGFLTTVLMMLTVLLCAFPAAAAEDEEDINGGTLTVSASITADSGLGELDVTADSSRFEVSSFGFIGAGSSWKPGEVPKIKVVLTAAEGYRFSTRVNTNKITVKGQGTCTAVKRLGLGASIEVTIRLKPVGGSMGTVEEAFWLSSPIGKAKWDAAENASAYELRLYYKDNMIKKIDKTTTTTFDFYGYMTKVGPYYFKVRPIPRSSTEASYLDTGEWTGSDELYIDRANVAPEGTPVDNGSSGGGPSSAAGPGGGNNSSQNWNGAHPQFGWVQSAGGWWYHDTDGSYPVSTWRQIDGKWYLFDVAGYMKTGWQKWNNKDYYLTVNGDMVTGWFEDNKKWYYMGGDGAMWLGWVSLDGKWYYLQSDGTRAEGWRNIGNKWYYLQPGTGVMMTDTYIDRYYVNQDGIWLSETGG